MDVRAVDEAAAADAAASARIRSASLLQEQPGFWHSHRTPRSVSSAITFTRLRRHVRGHHLSSPRHPTCLSASSTSPCRVATMSAQVTNPVNMDPSSATDLMHPGSERQIYPGTEPFGSIVDVSVARMVTSELARSDSAFESRSHSRQSSAKDGAVTTSGRSSSSCGRRSKTGRFCRLKSERLWAA